jgi:hypothetical protein
MRSTLANFIRSPTKFTALSLSKIRPNSIGYVQTDGSFSRGNVSRTAVILNTCDNVNYSLINTYFDHNNSNESEWCSVLNGIVYAQKKNQGSVELENDCLPVIKHLITRRPPTKSYLMEYYTAIFREVRHMEYLSIRWIPRELNKADDLFRIN